MLISCTYLFHAYHMYYPELTCMANSVKVGKDSAAAAAGMKHETPIAGTWPVT